MSFEPSNIIKLMNVPWDASYQNMRYFSSKSEQDGWFSNRSGRTYEGYTMSKPGVPIVCKGSYINALDFNYLMFHSPDYGTRTIYAFITDIAWRSEDSFSVSFEIDIFQTYFWDFNFSRTFIEREHTVDDVVPLTPEPIDGGEIVYTDASNMFPDAGLYYYCLASTPYKESETSFIDFGGFPEGMILYASDNLEVFGVGIDVLNREHDGSVKQCFCLPKTIVPKLGQSPYGDTFYQVVGFEDLAYTKSVSRPETLDGYTPKNNKMFTHPYCFLTVSNYQGQQKEYMFEYANTNDTLVFEAHCRIGSCSVVDCIPTNYKGQGGLIDNIMLQNAPQMSYASDYFSGWMERNAVNLAASTVNGIAMNAVTGNAFGAVASGINSAINIASTVSQAKHTANPANVNSSVLQYLTANNKYNFLFLISTCSRDYARSADAFFTHFGYNVSRYKNISFKNRSSYTYVKTNGCVVRGACPQTARQKMAEILDSGATFWCIDAIGDYSVDNT